MSYILIRGINDTCIFLNKNKLYKYTHIFIRDGSCSGRPRPEDEFCLVLICPLPKIFKTKIILKNPGTGRSGRDKVEYP